ncbi:DUF3305 domain-containing protein [Moritella sp. Urea-trap-13]|uniref:DUF3305 domain-containing protein n=1 Tax=Moritella sp. Urea-trap-13 TaxID=2058327 RepID=UPI000C333F63|nr:DUF3305 domain-containing protein [Moritella sp. Urea-trap-13]PKH04673.1 DUF3305 domain-containing protein [Moritella sp. Urea-trap-13]
MQLCDEDKHLNKGDEHKRLEKDESSWPIAFSLRSEEKQVGRWTTLSWSIEDVELYQQVPVITATEDSSRAGSTTHYEKTLFLYRDERTDYRFNLSSQDPHLFIVCEVADEQFSPLLITAAQSVASSYMDGDYQVLHIQMPLPIQAWMEAFIGRNGELIEFKKKRCKDRKGRSSGQ